MCLKWHPKYGIVGPTEEGFSLYLLYRNRYFFCRTFNVHKALSMLEDVGDFDEGSIYIEPPPVAANTDEDNADEDECATAQHLVERCTGFMTRTCTMKL